MSDTFRQSYAALTDFIANHPEVEIGDSVISIPDSARAAFYDLFNEARSAFVEERFPMHLSRSATLLENHRKAEEKTGDLLSFDEEGPTVSGLWRYLRDPKGSLTRELFDPLFDLLKGRENIDSFWEKSSEKVEEVFPPLFRGGYEKWAILSLGSLLEAQSALRVNVRNLNPGERAKTATYAPADDVPSPQESASFVFSQPRNAVFAVPDFIIHSSRLNRFVGIRSEFKEGLYHALNASPERDWLPVDIDLLLLLESGLTLVYVAESAASIALVADVSKFCRPDLVLWCIDAQNLTRKDALEKMTRAHALLNPPKGSFVIANEPWPDSPELVETDLQAQIAEQTAGVRLLTVCYDASALMPVVEALEDGKGAATTT
jgi:hypothetical protein